MSVSAVLGPQLVAMGVAVKNPSATASFGVPKTSPWRGSVGGGFEYEEKEQHRMLTDFEGVARKNEVGFRIWTSKEFHQYQVVGRKLPMASNEHPKIYQMKLWATNEVHAKSKYFMRKLKKVKKSNGQVLAINEVT